MGKEPLVNKTYLLKKMEGKGGWTYVEIPEIAQRKDRYFGLVRVKGWIDDFEIKQCNLMPMGNGHLFLPVRAEIRKKIKKQGGDTVQIILYADDLPDGIPEELLDCLKEEPLLFNHFQTYSIKEQKMIVEWIYSAKTDNERIERIAQTLEKISLQQ